MGNLTLPLTIHCSGASQDTVVINGDSFDEGFGNQPGLGGGHLSMFGEIIQRMQVHAMGNLATPAANKIILPQTGLIPWHNDGKSGTGVADLAANYPTRTNIYNPTLVFWHLSQNDWGANQTLWRTHATQYADGVEASFPSVRWCMLSNYFGASEKWTAGGWDQAVGSNTQVTTLNALGLSWMQGRDLTRWVFMDIRGNAITDPNTVLNFESIHNTPAPGATSGIIMDSTSHPIKSKSPVTAFSGYEEVSKMVLANCTVIL